jgi:hypothetical protein
VGQEQASSSSPSTLVLSLSFTSQNLTPDGLSLLSLKSAVDQMSDVGLAFSNWNENDTTLCGWSGISCMKITGFSDPRVVRIAVAAADSCEKQVFRQNPGGNLDGTGKPCPT